MGIENWSIIIKTMRMGVENMNGYFVELSEYEFLQIFAEKIVFHHSFEEQTLLLFLIDNKITAIGEARPHNTIIINHLLLPEDRLLLVGDIRQTLVNEWGVDIATCIQHKKEISGKTISRLLTVIKEKNDAFAFYTTNLDHLLEEAEKEWKDEQKKKKKKESNQSKIKRTETLKNESHSDHSKAQYLLKKIGDIVNCQTWIASNDKNREFKDELLGENSLSVFPSFSIEKKERIEEEELVERSIDEDTRKRIELIDTVWFKDGQPVAAFEVETTTSVYSGLLRFCDMLATIPNNRICLYIVAPNERKEKVMKELKRPVFQALGLTDHCQFISIEELELLYQKVKGLDGFVSREVLNVIARDVKGETYV